VEYNIQHIDIFALIIIACTVWCIAALVDHKLNDIKVTIRRRGETRGKNPK
jgi:hypothetical protein